MPSSGYANQLQHLDNELNELCSAFHDPSSDCGREARLYAIAEAKQRSVTTILTQILNDKKHELPFLLTQESIRRPSDLRVSLIDDSAESLAIAARLANKSFKQALRAMLAELNLLTDEKKCREEVGEDLDEENGGTGHTRQHGRLIVGRVKTLAGIIEKRKRGATNIFDLNRATIVFENEAELQAILAALPRFFFGGIVYLDNKFKKQWDKATQPPCLHLNLLLKPEQLPAELRSLLCSALAPSIADEEVERKNGAGEVGAGWVVELQLSMRDFLDVKQRCHAIYEILRLRVAADNDTGRNKNNVETSGEEKFGNDDKNNTTGTSCLLLPLPRACPKCGMLRHYVKSSRLQHVADVSFGQKLVKKCLLDGTFEVAHNVIAIQPDQCRLLEQTFLREVGLLARLEHPNVLQILGVVRDKESLGFVTEWMPQGSLWQCLQDEHERQHLDAWWVALQLCDALVYVHSHGVVHFDLKSKNVLLARNSSSSSSSFSIKLCDFGLSQDINESTLKSGVRVGGTPNWQAPETWGDMVSFHPSADVYGFGGVLIELFGQKLKPGCFPWMRERADRIRIKRQLMNRAKPPELEFVEEPKIKLLVMECLSFDAESRPTMKKVKARLVAAHIDSPSFDSDTRRILMALEGGTLSFPDLFATLQATPNWPATVSFLKIWVKESPCFEVALAMCFYFDTTLRRVVDNNDNEATEIASLFLVCERHMTEVVAAKFVAGWCSFHGTGGAHRNEERAVRYYRQAAFQGYPAAQYELGLSWKRRRGREDGQSLVENQLEKKQAVSWFLKAAEQGHIGAQLSLVRQYQVGEGVKLNTRLGEDWLNRAARGLGHKTLSMRYNWAGECFKHGKEVERDQEEAERLCSMAKAIELFHLAVRYQNGRGMDQDPTEAARLYRLAAARGNAHAMNNLGLCCQNGQGVQQDLTEAVRLYRLAAEQGYAPAQFNLGWCFHNGHGVQQDFSEAVRLYRLAAEQGYAPAQGNLGVCYENGQGVREDMIEAVRLYRLAADQGYAQAQYNLGLWYASGHAVPDVTEAARLIRLSANQGYAPAQCSLGWCYKNGRGVQRDVKKAARQFRLAADQGYAPAQCSLGWCFKNGRGVQQDEVEAARLYRLAADQGNSLAQCDLGVCYEYGQGVQQNLTEAIRLYQLAAEQGNSLAQFNLGVCYEYGQGVQQDLTEAAILYRLAAEEMAPAQCNLGVCYENGKGVQRDLDEAVRLYRLAAEQGYAPAQSNLGWCYNNGQGVQQDVDEAVRLYRLAADQGYAQAQYNLGVCYDNGRGVLQDLNEAARLYQLAADQGNSLARCNLGVCYQNGQGVQQDVTEAVRLYRLVAEEIAQAQCNLGLCYEYGQGVQSDITEAVGLYRLAAAQGNALAQYALGWCYDYGQGEQRVQQDAIEAVRMYRLAAAQGFAPAQCNLGVCYDKGQGVQQDLNEAMRLYRLAANKGNAQAQCNLALCYDDGQGVQQDLPEAIWLYLLAAEQGYAPAQFNLGWCFHNGHGVQQDFSEAVRLYRLAAEQGYAPAQGNLGVCYENGQGVREDMIEAVRLYRLAADQGYAQAQCYLGMHYSTIGRFVEAVVLYMNAANQGHAQGQLNLGMCCECWADVPSECGQILRLYQLAADQGNAQAQSKLRQFSTR